MEKKLTCIVCPIGCDITLITDNTGITDIIGNGCPRGKDYARNEFTAPVRTVTSTVLCTDGSTLSVKTENPIPKEKMALCMEIINSTVAALPIHIGDTVIDNVFGTKIIATQNKETD